MVDSLTGLAALLDFAEERGLTVSDVPSVIAASQSNPRAVKHTTWNVRQPTLNHPTLDVQYPAPHLDPFTLLIYLVSSTIPRVRSFNLAVDSFLRTYHPQPIIGAIRPISSTECSSVTLTPMEGSCSCSVDNC